MGKRCSRVLGVVLLAVTGLAASAIAASANQLSISSTSFRVTYAPMYFSTEALTVECPVTLEGSFHSARITKEVLQPPIGVITRAAAGACDSGSVRMLSETLPWHIYYLGFSGTLPNITQIQLMVSPVNASWSGWVTCLYEAVGAEAVRINANRNPSTGQMGTLSPETFMIEPISGRGAFCIGGFPATLSGTGIVTTPGGRDGVFVRLI